MKILYYYSQLNIGGAERSTVRLLNKFVEKGHDVTLLLRWDGGTLEHELNPKITRIYLKKSNGKPMGKCTQVVETLKSCVREMGLKKNEYDVVISGLFGYDPKILFKKIRAKQYYQLLRNDVEKTGSYGKTASYMDKYGAAFDAYIGVSEYTTQSFRKCYPQYADRALTIYNILPDVPENIGPVPEIMSSGEGKLKILTVCRLADKAKGLFRMVRVCKALHEEFGDVFRWYVVGNGPDREELSRQIADAGLSQVMILCGETNDPFVYYKGADLVAVLSYYEGLCGVVNESKMMQKPVIATLFSGIHEQLKDGYNGYIVDNDEGAILQKMREILAAPEKIKKLGINGMPEELLSNDKKIVQYETLFQKLEKGAVSGK